MGDTTETKVNKPKNPFRVQKFKEDKERRQKKRARLIVRNVSYKVNEEILKKHFEQWGVVEEVNLLKRPDGKLVGCAFIQFETINQATKAISKGNAMPLLERPIYIDWALGKNEYVKKVPKAEVKDEIKEEPTENNLDTSVEHNSTIDSVKEEDEEEAEVKEEDEDSDDDENYNESMDENEDEDEDEDKSNIEKVDKRTEKQKSNDVVEGCTVFIKNVSFDATENDLRKVLSMYGDMHYAIINRHELSGHSKGTAFVKFKRKECADMCLAAGSELVLMDEILEVHPALSREEMKKQAQEKENAKSGKDSRNLYLAREGLIMAGSKAAEGVSAADITKRHKLEQIKTQVLKNLNRFVSRNRLSIHNLPLSYDNNKLKEMIIKHTNFKPHECRVMREKKITAEDPEGKSKGFGFMSFATHQEALTALRKLNNNPTIFGPKKRPIVAFSIEDRSVHKLKEARQNKSKLNNPTFIEKQEKQQIFKKRLKEEKLKNGKITKDIKSKVKQEIKKLENLRTAKNKKVKNRSANNEEYMGTAAKPGTVLKMRSNKKINEQTKEHMKRVKKEKRKVKQTKIRQSHLAERKEDVRPKQKRKGETDDISHLISKYKTMITKNNEDVQPKVKKQKRTKWYQDS